MCSKAEFSEIFGHHETGNMKGAHHIKTVFNEPVSIEPCRFNSIAPEISSSALSDSRLWQPCQP